MYSIYDVTETASALEEPEDFAMFYGYTVSCVRRFESICIHRQQWNYSYNLQSEQLLFSSILTLVSHFLVMFTEVQYY